MFARQSLSLLLPFFLICYILPGPGFAQTFTTVVPAACPVEPSTVTTLPNPHAGPPNQTAIPWRWFANGSATENWVERNVFTLSNYHNNQTTVRRFIANSRVGNLSFKFTKRDMPDLVDMLKFHQQGQPVGDTRYANGIWNSSYWQNVPSTTLARFPMTMTFTSDSAVNGTGFQIEEVAFCRTPEVYPGYMSIASGERYTGVLLGTSDTIYLTINGAHPGRRLHVATSETPTSASLDIYVRCGAKPTPTTYLRRTNTASANDFLHVTDTECSHTQTVFIAINSRSGQGAFSLLVSRFGLAYDQNYAIEAPTTTQLGNVAMGLIGLRQYFYGATEGQILLRDFHLYQRSSIGDSLASCASQCAGCSMCFIQESGRSYANYGGWKAVIRRGAWIDTLSWRTWAHELGHSILNLPDEYDEPTGLARCGHSVMATNLSDDFCTDSNHSLDPSPGAPSITWVPVWNGPWVYELYGEPPHATPDASIFFNHELNGTIYIH